MSTFFAMALTLVAASFVSSFVVRAAFTFAVALFTPLFCLGAIGIPSVAASPVLFSVFGCFAFPFADACFALVAAISSSSIVRNELRASSRAAGGTLGSGAAVFGPHGCLPTRRIFRGRPSLESKLGLFELAPRLGELTRAISELAPPAGELASAVEARCANPSDIRGDPSASMPLDPRDSLCEGGASRSVNASCGEGPMGLGREWRP